MENNPLKQYFRRPAVYIKLPSNGVGYPEGSLDFPENAEFPVYPMTAIDEITSKTPDALFNGEVVVELIKSCVPNIKKPWEILSNDLDAILIAIKAASGNNNLDINTKCPKCSEESSYSVNLVGVLSTLKTGDYDKELEINNLKIKFKPVNYKTLNSVSIEQLEVQKMFETIANMNNDEKKIEVTKSVLAKITDLTMKIISNAIEYIQTPEIRVEEKEYILDFLKNCDKNTYNSIKDYNTVLKTSTEIKPLNIKCTHCGNQYSQPFTLNPSDFFG